MPESMQIEIDAPSATGEHAVRLTTGAGEQGRHTMKLPLDDPTSSAFQTQLLYGGVQPSEDEIAAFGQLALRTLIGNAAMAGLFNAALSRAEQRITLCFDPQATAALSFPWEFIASASGLPLLRNHSLRRTLASTQPLSTLKTPGTIRMLLAGALPAELASTYPIDIAGHFAALRSALQPLIDAGRLELIEQPHLTSKLLKQYASEQQPHIVHLLCHGVMAPASQAALVLEDGSGGRNDISSRQLALALETGHPRLVVINGCYSSRIAGSPWHAIAPLLLEVGIPMVVAAQAALSQQAARIFSGELYRGLIEGRTSLDACIARGRRALIIEDGASTDWGLLTLYSRANDDRLFGGDGEDPGRVMPPAPDPNQGRTASINFGNHARPTNTSISIGAVPPGSPDLDAQAWQHIRDRRAILQARLAHLEKQRAVMGINVDYKIVYEIEQVQADLRAIDERLH